MSCFRRGHDGAHEAERKFALANHDDRTRSVGLRLFLGSSDARFTNKGAKICVEMLMAAFNGYMTK
jgi:hypothetical protein